MLDKFLKAKQPLRILRVGCGWGINELWIAKKYPFADIVAIDISPYNEAINQVASDLNITNIQFITNDLRDANLGFFDIIQQCCILYFR